MIFVNYERKCVLTIIYIIQIQAVVKQTLKDYNFKIKSFQQISTTLLFVSF